MMNRVSSPSAPLLTLGHHVRACTNQATVLFLLPSWTYAKSRYTKLHSKQMQRHSHMWLYLLHINKIKQTFVHLREQNNYTCTQTCTNTHFCNPCYDAIAVRGFTAAPTAGIPHWQLQKKTYYKTMSSHENRENIWTGNSAFLRFLSQKITEVNSMLLQFILCHCCYTIPE